MGTLGIGGREEDLDFSIGKDRCANVAAFNHIRARAPNPPLLVCHGRAHAGRCRDRADRLVNLSGANGGGDVGAVDKDGLRQRVAFDMPELDVAGTRKLA